MAEKTKEQLRKDIAVYKAEIKKLKEMVEEGKKVNKDNAIAYTLAMRRKTGIIKVLRWVMVLQFIINFVLAIYIILA